MLQLALATGSMARQPHSLWAARPQPLPDAAVLVLLVCVPHAQEAGQGSSLGMLQLALAVAQVPEGARWMADCGVLDFLGVMARCRVL